MTGPQQSAWHQKSFKWSELDRNMWRAFALLNMACFDFRMRWHHAGRMEKWEGAAWWTGKGLAQGRFDLPLAVQLSPPASSASDKRINLNTN